MWVCKCVGVPFSYLMWFVGMCACGCALVLNPQSAICQDAFVFLNTFSTQQWAWLSNWLLSYNHCQCFPLSLLAKTTLKIFVNIQNPVRPSHRASRLCTIDFLSKKGPMHSPRGQIFQQVKIMILCGAYHDVSCHSLCKSAGLEWYILRSNDIEDHDNYSDCGNYDHDFYVTCRVRASVDRCALMAFINYSH